MRIVVKGFKATFKRSLYVLSSIILAVSTSLSVYATPSFSGFPISSSYTNPSQVTTAAGSLWYIEGTTLNPNTYIGRMTTSGSSTDYDIRTLSGKANLTISSLVTGPDGNVWFGGNADNTSSGTYAGFLNVSTGTVTIYMAGTSGYGAGPLVAGSDGNIWYFIKSLGSPAYTYLVRVDPATGTKTIAHTFDTYSNLTNITSGSDGRIWISDQYYDSVWAVNTTSGAASSYAVPTLNGNPGSIASGPDGNLWLTEGGKIAKLTTGGSFTEYTASGGDFVAGPDGAVWYLNNSGSTKKIGRITSTGGITEYAIPGSGVTGAYGMALGPDNAMWFSYKDSAGAKLGRLGY